MAFNVSWYIFVGAYVVYRGYLFQEGATTGNENGFVQLQQKIIRFINSNPSVEEARETLAKVKDTHTQEYKDACVLDNLPLAEYTDWWNLYWDFLKKMLEDYINEHEE
jgi:hypothetical protein